MSSKRRSKNFVPPGVTTSSRPGTRTTPSPSPNILNRDFDSDETVRGLRRKKIWGCVSPTGKQRVREPVSWNLFLVFRPSTPSTPVRLLRVVRPKHFHGSQRERESVRVVDKRGHGLCYRKFQTSSENCIGGRLPALSTKLITGWNIHIYISLHFVMSAGGVFGLSPSLYRARALSLSPSTYPQPPHSSLFLLPVLPVLPMTNQTERTKHVEGSPVISFQRRSKPRAESTPVHHWRSSNFIPRIQSKSRHERDRTIGSPSWIVSSSGSSIFANVPVYAGRRIGSLLGTRRRNVTGRDREI